MPITPTPGKQKEAGKEEVIRLVSAPQRDPASNKQTNKQIKMVAQAGEKRAIISYDPWL